MKTEANTNGWKEAGREPVIAVEGLTARFGEETILENVSFEVFRGEILCIVGGSGCGKSTLLKHMIGLHTACRRTGACGGGGYRRRR